MNKKAQFFSVPLVFMVIIMGAMMIGAFLHYENKIAASLVSPKTVLESQHAKDLFEILEQKSLSKAYKIAKFKYPKIKESSEDFQNKLLDEFTNQLINQDLDKFIFQNLYLDQKQIDPQKIDKKSFLKNLLYSVEYKNKHLIVYRNKDLRVEKRHTLQPKESSISFAMIYIDSFQKKYELKSE